MDFIELIFALLGKFVSLDTVKLGRLEADGKKWYAELGEDPDTTHPLLLKLKNYGEQWYTQVAMAIASIFLTRVIYDFLNPAQDDDDDE